MNYLLLLIPVFSVAEGTKQVMPFSAHPNRIQLHYSFSNFAMYGCAPEDRLNIRIKDPGEIIYFGFGQTVDASQNSQNDVYFRIIAPNGSIVYSQTLIPASGNGYIGSYSQAIAGPNVFNPAGYAPLSLTTTMSGDYYLEFAYSNSGVYSRREFTFFDITVVNSISQPIDGRIWSKAWQFTATISRPPAPNAYDNPFYGKVYIYSDDSIVTSVDFNGMKPYVFTLSANATGTGNTGNPITDRKSVQGRSTYPQYKIFLNDPDTICFPSGTHGFFSGPLTFTGCLGSFCLNVSVNKPGAVSVLFELNGIPGYQSGTRDVSFTKNVQTGVNCILWNGKDGFGNVVPPGTYFPIYAAYVDGLTHIPIYDVESNPNGFIVELVRPVKPNSTFRLYWDDSNFSNPVLPPSGGCSGSLGCHVFPYMYGDLRTINTYWYATSNVVDSIHVDLDYVHFDSIVVTKETCVNTKDGTIEVYAHGGKPPYQFSIGNSPFSPVSLFTGLGVGRYNITVKDSLGCIFSSEAIIGDPTPTSYFTANSTVCLFDTLSVIYTGNCQPSNTYHWDFDGATIISGSGQGPYEIRWNSSGTHTIELWVDRNGCITNTTRRNVNVLPLPPAEFIMDSIICIGDTLSVNYSGTVSPTASYHWNFSGGTIISGTGAGPYQIYYPQTGVYPISLNVNDYGCKSDTITKNVMVAPIPTSTYTIKTDVCLGDTFDVTYTGSASPTANYNWDFNVGTIISGSGQGPLKVLFNSSGTFYTSLTVTEYGCSSSSTVPVNVKILPTAYFEPFFPQCYQFPAIITYTGNALATATYTWNFGTGTLVSGAGQGPYQIRWPNPGKYPVSLEVFENGCTSPVFMDSVELYQLTPFIDSLKHVSCNGGNDGFIRILSMTGVSPFAYNWLPPAGNNDTASNLYIGTYSAFLTDSMGCIDLISVEITEPPPLSIATFTEKASCWDNCDGNATVLVSGGVPPYAYTWNTTPAQTSHTAIGLYPGYYQVMARDSNNCLISAVDSVGIRTLIEADFDYDSKSSLLEEYIVDFMFTGYGASVYSWDFGDGGISILANPTHTYTNNIDKIVTLIVNSGLPDYCIDTVVKPIDILPPLVIFAPNSFTPNGDWINDRFFVVVPQVKAFEMQIFNRWGEMIFSSKDPFEGWDGTYKGEACPQGVYSYVVKVIGFQFQEKAFWERGTIILGVSLNSSQKKKDDYLPVVTTQYDAIFG